MRLSQAFGKLRNKKLVLYFVVLNFIQCQLRQSAESKKNMQQVVI